MSKICKIMASLEVNNHSKREIVVSATLFVRPGTREEKVLTNRHVITTTWTTLGRIQIALADLRSIISDLLLEKEEEFQNLLLKRLGFNQSNLNAPKKLIQNPTLEKAKEEN